MATACGSFEIVTLRILALFRFYAPQVRTCFLAFNAKAHTYKE